MSMTIDESWRQDSVNAVYAAIRQSVNSTRAVLPSGFRSNKIFSLSFAYMFQMPPESCWRFVNIPPKNVSCTLLAIVDESFALTLARMYYRFDTNTNTF